MAKSSRENREIWSLGAPNGVNGQRAESPSPAGRGDRGKSNQRGMFGKNTIDVGNVHLYHRGLEYEIRRSAIMKPYKNLSGNSGVVSYEIGPDFVRVWFRNGPWYLYTYASAGPSNIEQMKVLAGAGMELSTFISTVRPSYASKSTC